MGGRELRVCWDAEPEEARPARERKQNLGWRKGPDGGTDPLAGLHAGPKSAWQTQLPTWEGFTAAGPG